MTTSAREYHRRTGYSRNTLGGHYLDWGNQPSVLKHYPSSERVELREVDSWPEIKLSELLSIGGIPVRNRVIEADPARILALAHCVTATTRHGGMEFHFRNVASAGALYPFELYVATRGASGVDNGLFHHGIVPQHLTRLRSGDILPEIGAALPQPPGDGTVFVFFLTSIFFRSAWKYRARSYRYDLLDTGHLLESLILAVRCAGLSPMIHYDFHDGQINELLGVDPTREACMVVVRASSEAVLRSGGAACGPLIPNTEASSRVAPLESEYPEIQDVHAASSILPVGIKHVASLVGQLGLDLKPWSLIPDPSPAPEMMSYPQAVFKRRSSRNFVKNSLGADSLLTLLKMISFSEDPIDPPEAETGSLVPGFLANRVDGMEPGFYLIDRKRRMTTQVRAGSLGDHMADVCLGQGWLANCATHFMFMTDLEAIEAQWGPRGYRYSMLTAGRLGQRIYLASTAMKIGCCGVGAFFDEEAESLLGLKDTAAMVYLVGAGPTRKWSLG